MKLIARSRTALVGSAAIALVGTLPASAAAQPYEQVSRTSGAYLTAKATENRPMLSAVGDVGRFAAFRGTFPGGPNGAWIRDVRNNLTTQPGGAATKQIWGFDRAETKALIAREVNGQVELRIAPLVGGGTSKLIYSTTGAYYAGVEAQLSGDGSTVVVLDTFASRFLKINVATGAVTNLPTPAGKINTWNLLTQAISDDGRTVVLNPFYFGNDIQVHRDGLPVLLLPGGSGGLSPDGTTLFFERSGSGLVVRKLATGSEVSTPWVGYERPWISSDGSKIIAGAVDRLQQLDLQSGEWTVLTGPFANLSGVRSPSGKFLLRNEGNQAVLLDRTGAELVGGTDPFSADLYIKLGATYQCGGFLQKNFGTVNTTLLTQPIPYAPKSTRADVQLYVDVSLLKTATLLPGQVASAAFKGNPTFYRAISTVTDELGRVTKGENKLRFGGCA